MALVIEYDVILDIAKILARIFSSRLYPRPVSGSIMFEWNILLRVWLIGVLFTPVDLFSCGVDHFASLRSKP
jgi:hypothetical protein